MIARTEEEAGTTAARGLRRLTARALDVHYNTVRRWLFAGRKTRVVVAFKDLQVAAGLDEAQWQTLWNSSAEAMAALQTSHKQAQRLLTHDDQAYFVSLVGEALRAASALEERAAPKAILAQIADKAETFVEGREATLGRRRYASGLLAGILISIALLVAGYFVFTGVVTGVARRPLNTAEQFALRDLLTCIGAGTIGASISVLLRISSRRHVDYETILQGAARWRILLGWGFAITLICLVKSGIVTLFDDPTAVMLSKPDSAVTDAERVTSWFFWAALGLLAGFNERWATQLLTRGRDENYVAGDEPALQNNRARTQRT